MLYQLKVADSEKLINYLMEPDLYSLVIDLNNLHKNAQKAKEKQLYITAVEKLVLKYWSGK